MWIEVHQSLLTHRKTLRLGRLLGLDKFSTVGRLVGLWTWCLDNAPNGTIGASDKDILADVMGWEGDPDTLISALIATGFLETDTEIYVIHDWEDYAGRLLERREASAQRQRRYRENHKTETSASRNAHVTVTSHTRSASTVPNLTVPNLTRSIERAREPEAQTETPIDRPATTTNDERPNALDWLDGELVPIAEAVLKWLVDDPPIAAQARASFTRACQTLATLGATPEEIPKRGQRLLNRPNSDPIKLRNWGPLAKYWQDLEMTHGTPYGPTYPGPRPAINGYVEKPRRYVAALHRPKVVATG